MCKRQFIFTLSTLFFPWLTFQGTNCLALGRLTASHCKGTKHMWAPSISSTVSHCSVSLICFPPLYCLSIILSLSSSLLVPPPQILLALSRSSSPLFTLSLSCCLPLVCVSYLSSRPAHPILLLSYHLLAHLLLYKQSLVWICRSALGDTAPSQQTLVFYTRETTSSKQTQPSSEDTWHQEVEYKVTIVATI